MSIKFDELEKSLILLAPQAIFNAGRIMNLSPKLLDVAHKRFFTRPSNLKLGFSSS